VSVPVHCFAGPLPRAHEPAQTHFFQFRSIPAGSDERRRQALDIIRRRQSPVHSRLHASRIPPVADPMMGTA
jgi:hypothetical protein